MSPALPARRHAVLVKPSVAAAEQEAASLIAQLLVAGPNAVLGLATGRSMIGVYEELVRRCERGDVSFARAQSFNLDEYCGLPAEHPASFAAYMDRHLFGAVDIDPARAHLPDGNAPDGARAYEDAIAAAGGIDLQLLGIGRNGHIGFNEPGSDRDTRTRIVDLAQETRKANAPDFPDGLPVPDRAITMGIATIMKARRIVLLATGAAKAEALADALEGAVGKHNPASFLRLHPDVTIVCDPEAAHTLTPPTEMEKRHG
ncbi:glucosamine-6-phosphate deaminase [Pelagibacterium montanilacus]|uniref:glucosamine-6-phosphate deaminase n=1 Tax=Pelagibacterium montanilacus TaxID=2185280 RepID=UPI000F8F81A9|nr:glucosamine-6-phosphate deaminase [Pelagibacterium montanilacus]